MKIKNKTNPIKELFSGWTVLFHLIFYFIINSVFLVIVTKNSLVSVIAAIPASYIFFISISVVQKKIGERMLVLKELNKYTNSLTFYLNAGQNVPNALRNTLSIVHPVLQIDIKKTLDILSKETVLDTSHFQKYNLTSLDLYHQTLLVKYDKGGKSKDLFMRPLQGVQFEISEIDGLIRSKAATANQVYTMILFAIGIVGGVSFLPGDVYETFLSLPISLFVLLGFYSAILYNISKLQKDKADLSLRL